METNKYAPSVRLRGKWKSDGDKYYDDRILLFFYLFNNGNINDIALKTLVEFNKNKQ